MVPVMELNAPLIRETAIIVHAEGALGFICGNQWCDQSNAHAGELLDEYS